MSREELLKVTIEKLNQLSDKRLEEVSEYVSFLANRIDDKILNDGIKNIISDSKSYEFLREEDELYKVSDIKEKFNCESLVTDFSVNEEMKDLLDERRSTSSNEDYVSWEEVKNQIRFKSK